MSAAPFSVTCDRYEECQARLRDACDRLACPFRQDHPRDAERLRQLETRMDKHDKAIEALEGVAAGIREELSGMRGEVRGALAASKLSGSIIGGLVTFGGTALLGVIGWLATRHGP